MLPVIILYSIFDIEYNSPCCILYQIYSILLFRHRYECAFAQEAQNICDIQGTVSLPLKMVKNYVIKSVKNLKVYGNLVSLIK